MKQSKSQTLLPKTKPVTPRDTKPIIMREIMPICKKVEVDEVTKAVNPDFLLTYKLKLIQSNKELLENKIKEFERKLGRVRVTENHDSLAKTQESKAVLANI